MRPPLAIFRCTPACLHAETILVSSSSARLLDPDLLCFHPRRGTRSHSLLGPFGVRRLAAAFLPSTQSHPSQLKFCLTAAFHESSYILNIETLRNSKLCCIISQCHF